MADVATPSAIGMTTADTTLQSSNPPPTDGKPSSKPEKPDEAAFKEQEAKLKKNFESAQAKTKDQEAKFNAAKPNNRESPNGQRQAQLKAELGEIRTKQSGNKASRTGVQDRLNALDGKLKTQIQEQKNQRAKFTHKNVEELDAETKQLEAEVDSGKLRIVDEKKNLDTISQLRSKRKQFAGVENIQKNIDSIKQQITETKKELDNPEARALSAEYDTKQAELNKLKAEQDSEFKNRDSHRDAWRSAKDAQSKAFGELKALRDEYFGNKRAFDTWEREARKQQFQRREAERKQRDLEYKKRKMQQELDEASEPAYGAEISACNSLIRILDPSSAPAEKAPLLSSKFGATPQRQVEATEFKGTRLSKKGEDEEAYFVGTGGKKGKKGRKGQQADGAAAKSADVGKFYGPGVAEQFDMIKVKQPGSAEDQPRVLEEVKEKMKYYEANQDAKTKENVAAVQKRFDALEASTPTTNGNAAHVNGDAAESTSVEPSSSTKADSSSIAQSMNHAADSVSKDLEATSISEKPDGEAES